MQPQQGRPLFDIGNTHLTPELSADMDIGKIPVPGGEVGVATLRQGNATLTLFLDRAAAGQFGDLFHQLRDNLSETGKLATGAGAALVQAVSGQRL